jgi:hypothetical protein
MPSTTTPPRTWHAQLHFGSALRPEVLEATPQRLALTLRDTARAASREAAEYLQAGLATECRVVMFKTTKAHGTVEDRQAAYLWLGDDGAVFVQRDRAC